MFTEERIIQAYASVARPILLRYLTRRSCIASAHVAHLSLKAFGVSVRTVPVHLQFSIPALEVAYIAGITASEKERSKAVSRDWVELDEGTAWNGHVVLNFRNRSLIDPSFDQAFAAIAAGGVPIPANPLTLVLPLEGHSLTPGVRARYSLRMDPPEDHMCEVLYIVTDDNSYRDTPAWQDEAIPFIVDHVVSAVRAILI